VFVENDCKLSRVLSQFALALSPDVPVRGILEQLVERIVDVLPVTGAGVTFMSPGTARTYIAASDESALRFERLRADFGEGPRLSTYKSGEDVVIPEPSADDRFPGFAHAAEAAGLAAVFALPLRHRDGPLGVLDLYLDRPGQLDTGDTSTAQTLADVAVTYLLIAEAREGARAASDRFHHRALHDPLTGLPNRLLLQERLEHASQRAKRSHTTAAIAFADLDRFKEVNDSYGHQVGDELLRAVAQRLSGLVRSGDTVARFAGDEFVFLCEDLRGPADIDILAGRITAAFSTPFALPGAGITVTITASIGVACAGHADDISEQLIAKADLAMYRVKHQRRAARQTIDFRDALQSSEASSPGNNRRAALAAARRSRVPAHPAKRR
jgi:diguanylate cyclase (GGDEF)-like protein